MYPPVLVHDGHGVRGRPHLAGATDVMGGPDIAHQPGIQRLVRGQVRIRWRHPVAQEVLERRVRRQADGQADGLAQPLGVKGVGEMPVIQPRLHLGIGGGEA